jgi:enterochelin esterase-like enzyme
MSPRPTKISTTLGRDWDYTVYLPDGYDKSNLRYPVLFLLHGFSEDEFTWVSKGNINAVADQLIAAGEISPVLFVMPGSGNNWYVDNKEKIETAFINDLIPEIERKFRILPEREGAALVASRWEVTARSALSSSTLSASASHF